MRKYVTITEGANSLHHGRQCSVCFRPEYCAQKRFTKKVIKKIENNLLITTLACSIADKLVMLPCLVP